MTVRFDPGEPLDIDKLNQLSDAIVALEKNMTSSGLTSSTVVTKIPKVWAGAVGPDSGTSAVGTAGAIKKVQINYADAQFGDKPRVVAVSNKQKFMVNITNVQKTTADIEYTTQNGDLKSAPWIHWIAVYMEPNVK